MRTAWLTHVMLDVNAALTSQWTVRVVMLGTIAVLIAFRRFQHLAAYLVAVLAAALLAAGATTCTAAGCSAATCWSARR